MQKMIYKLAPKLNFKFKCAQLSFIYLQPEGMERRETHSVVLDPLGNIVFFKYIVCFFGSH